MKKVFDKRSEYKELKKQAGLVVTGILKAFPDLKDKLTVIARGRAVNESRDDKLLEVAGTYGDGDNRRGYYRAHLMIDLGAFEKKDHPNPLIYIVEAYVPEPDMDHNWETNEPDKIIEFNFSPTLKLFDDLRQYGNMDTALDLVRKLAERKYSTCLEVTDRELAYK